MTTLPELLQWVVDRTHVTASAAAPPPPLKITGAARKEEEEEEEEEERMNGRLGWWSLGKEGGECGYGAGRSE
ncbi:hypothetical protein Pmani_030680 [Petrolisthes manimaculis]|uniref:Uncharacterized protein n=1 Tax=Petrolisthes manimaculis TaxID=1843537 RepID=A0AAE1NXB5_9EUCA|nr:hypothetical protein Pmani_030680 [Petrolisthes manimaculis]